MFLCRLSEWPVLMSVWRAFLLNAASGKQRNEKNWLKWFHVSKWSFLFELMLSSFFLISLEPLLTLLTGGTKFMECLLLILFHYMNWWKSKPRGPVKPGEEHEGPGSSHLLCHVKCSKSFLGVQVPSCALSHAPLCEGAPHAGSHWKTSQFTLPCVISHRFCTSCADNKISGRQCGGATLIY